MVLLGGSYGVARADWLNSRVRGDRQESCAQTNAHNSKSSSTSRKLLILWESLTHWTFWCKTYVCSPKTGRAMAVQKTWIKQILTVARSEDSGIHLNGTFFPWKTLNITEMNGNIEKPFSIFRHFPVGLVSIARKLREKKPVKNGRIMIIIIISLTLE